MEKTKLVQVLKSLKKKEFLDLRKFLNSPFFNRREDVIQLYDFLSKQLKKKGAWPQKEIIYAGLFPHKKYKDANFHLLISYLFKLVEEFLSVRQFLQDDKAMKLRLVQSYRQRNLPGHFDALADRLKQNLNREEFRDGDYYDYFKKIYWEEYLMKVVADPSNSNLYLEDFSRMTDISFFAQKMRQICLLKVQRSIYKVAEPTQSFLPYISFLQEQDLIRIPAIGIYFYAFKFLQGEADEINFQKFKTLLFTKGMVFALSEHRELYLLAVNFCIKQVNDGNKTYFQEMFQLYQKALELNVLLENGKLSRFTYFNAVASGIQTEAFEWAKKIVYQYRDFLDEGYQESSFRFNLARIEYEQKRYEEALDLINNIHFSDILVSLAAKTIILKIYYHHQEFDLLDAHLNAMDKFVRRNRVLGYHKSNYLNIIRYTQKLIALNTFDKEAVQILRESIEQEEKLTEKKWFIEQLNGGD